MLVKITFTSLNLEFDFQKNTSTLSEFIGYADLTDFRQFRQNIAGVTTNKTNKTVSKNSCHTLLRLGLYNLTQRLSRILISVLSRFGEVFCLYCLPCSFTL